MTEDVKEVVLTLYIKAPLGLWCWDGLGSFVPSLSRFAVGNVSLRWLSVRGRLQEAGIYFKLLQCCKGCKPCRPYGLLKLATIWVDLGQSWPTAAVQWCCSILTDNQADVPRCGDSLWPAAPLLRGLFCWSEQGSAEKQNCCLSPFLVKRSGRERNIQRDPLPPRSLPLSWSIKNILELKPCLCSTVLEEDFCQDTDPLWILQMSLHLFFPLWKAKILFQTFAWSLAIRSYQKIYY